MTSNADEAVLFCPLEGENVRVSEACVHCDFWDGTCCNILLSRIRGRRKKSVKQPPRSSSGSRGRRVRVPPVWEKWPQGPAAEETDTVGERGPAAPETDYTGADRFVAEAEIEAEPDEEGEEEQEFDAGGVGWSGEPAMATERVEGHLDGEPMPDPDAWRPDLGADDRLPDAPDDSTHDELPGWPGSDEPGKGL